LSGQFFQRSLFAAVDEILCAIFASRTHRNLINQPKYRQIINCGLAILIGSLYSLCAYEIRHGFFCKLQQRLSLHCSS